MNVMANLPHSQMRIWKQAILKIEHAECIWLLHTNMSQLTGKLSDLANWVQKFQSFTCHIKWALNAGSWKFKRLSFQNFRTIRDTDPISGFGIGAPSSTFELFKGNLKQCRYGTLIMFLECCLVPTAFPSVCAEAFNPDDDEEDSEPRVLHPKTDEQRCRLQESCRDILLFKTLDQVCTHMSAWLPAQKPNVLGAIHNPSSLFLLSFLSPHPSIVLIKWLKIHVCTAELFLSGISFSRS